MASTYPTSLDVFTNPLTTNPLTAPSHAQQHSDINDAVEALEAKVAIGATVLGTYTAFTPTISGLTVGDGTLSSSFCRVNNYVHYFGKIVFGSTTSFSSGLQITVPVNIDSALATATGAQYGTVSFRDISAALTVIGTARAGASSATTMFVEVSNATGTYTFLSGLGTAIIPFTWATGDIISWNVYYKAA